MSRKEVQSETSSIAKNVTSSKKKVVLISDSPYATTGLGRMSKYFLKMLNEFDWHIWGFLHPHFNVRNGYYHPAFDPQDFPETQFQIESPKSYTNDQYGLELIPDMIKREKPDFVITSLDFDRALKILAPLKELQFIQNFKWINYFPMDREDYKAEEIESFRFPDVNICISKYGVEKIKSYDSKIDIKQIWHPIDKSEFPYVEPKDLREFKLKTFPGIKNNTFLLGTVNRSFSRKDTPRLVRIFSQFLQEQESTYAYVHGSRKTYEGMDLGKLAMENKAPKGRIRFLPEYMKEIMGYPDEIMNKIYRNLDLFVTVSCGEGFGFSTVEALLTSTPIIAPRNTSFPELVQDFGYLIEPSEYGFLQNSNTAMWPFVNVQQVVDKMHYVYNNYDEAKEKAKAGSEWVKKNLSLQSIAKEWRKILK